MKNYIEIEKESIKDFTNMLLDEGTVWYGISCRNNYISDVTLDGESINQYMPRRFACSDGSVYIEDPSKLHLLELLESSEGSRVVIYNHDEEEYPFVIIDGNVVWPRS